MAFGPMLVMKLNSMKPVNSSTAPSVPPTPSDSAASASPAAQPMKPMICRRMRHPPIGQQHGKHDSDDQQSVDEGGALGCQDIVLDDVADVARVLVLGADERCQDRGREDAD